MDSAPIPAPRNLRRELFLFLLVVAALGATSGMFETSFNNFLSDTFRLAAETRGKLEFPREFPGFLVAILGGALFFLSETRLGIICAGATAAGLLGLAALGSDYGRVVVFMLVWSAGAHMMMPVNSTISLSLAPPERRAAMLGRIGATGMGATIAGAGLVWVGMEYLHLPYRTIFALAACTALLAALFVSRMSPLPGRSGARPKLVLKRRYSLYYLLNVFSGARKQVFVTFGPWVLVKVFHEPAPTIAKIWVIASAVGIFFQPQLGRLIDRLGERTILTADALLMICVCLGYGFARQLPLAHPVRLVYVCYALDQILFACSMARATYLDKIAESEDDIHASLSVGVSIDHAVSMSIPTLGGMLWQKYGFPYVFLSAAAIALANLVAASFVRRRPHRPPAAHFPASDVTGPD
jgi:predicted MFS family arabinose efflux permease